MRQTLRSYATAGVALMGASLVAVTPVAAPLPGINMVRDVTLTTTGTLPDLLTPWIDQYNTASENASTLAANFFIAPGVGLQQAMVNQSDLVQQFLNDPTSGTLDNVMQQWQTNIDNVLTGIGLQGTSIGSYNQLIGWDRGSIAAMVMQHTMIGNHALMFAEVPGYIPADEQSLIIPIINFLGSPESAIVMGALGPMISPWVALSNSIADGDDFNTMMANVVGAFFNGADLNLDALLPAINGAGLFPPGMTMNELDFAFGGLLTTGNVQVADYVAGSSDVPAVGGSIFNSVGLQFNGVPTVGNLVLNSEPVGPIAAWEELSQTISGLLGSGWSDPTAFVGGGGSGSPSITLDVSAPGTGIDFPTLLNDLFGGSSTSVDTAATTSTDLSALVQDVLSWF